MGDSNRILTVSNAYLSVTNIAGTAATQSELQGLPLGTPNDSATGELAVKVRVVGSTTGGTTAITIVPDANASGTSHGHSTAYEASRIFKNSAGTLLVLKGYNSKGSAQFIQLHDSATLPADTAVPVAVITVPTVSNFEISYPVTGGGFGSGIVACNSSTGPTKTIGGADCWFEAVFK